MEQVLDYLASLSMHINWCVKCTYGKRQNILWVGPAWLCCLWVTYSLYFLPNKKHPWKSNLKSFKSYSEIQVKSVSLEAKGLQAVIDWQLTVGSAVNLRTLGNLTFYNTYSYLVCRENILWDGFMRHPPHIWWAHTHLQEPYVEWGQWICWSHKIIFPKWK